ncbi:MAG: hypothetical protein OXC64_01720 [Flavobacteriaceae bacterium]|nr:hypothetical protein [Flavobacteriaceae bacterium]
MSKKTYPDFIHVPIDQLSIDHQSPRLPDYLQGKPENDIIEFMLLEESILPLMQAIGMKGFFKGAPLLVVEKEKSLKVIEGNRRFISVKLLNHPGLVTVQQGLVKKIYDGVDKSKVPIEELPCLVFEDEKDIIDYLGYGHITGIQSWNLKQKAAYLNSLRSQHFNGFSMDEACHEIRKMMGCRKRVVKRYLVGDEIYSIIRSKRFFQITDLNENRFCFSYVLNSLMWENIAAYLGVDMDATNPIKNLNIHHIKNWTEWFYKASKSTKRRIGKTRLRGASDDLSKLNSILGHETARKNFIENNAAINEAYLYTKDIRFSFRDSISDSLCSMQKARNLSSHGEIFYNSLDDDLREVIRLSRIIKTNQDQLLMNKFESDEFQG